ncbi:MAG: hypothetical protein VKJ24_18845 [Synechococcales bacterium]|nr:hypothetical protein [Synechococcales bacterium]
MASYRYTALGDEIPSIPIISLELMQPGRFEVRSLLVSAILDTGSDCTIVPIPCLLKVNAQIADRPFRIPVGGQLSLAIPYEVGLRFDRFRHYVFRVYGCSAEEIGEMALIGRDLMNLYRIEFDGEREIFTIA